MDRRDAATLRRGAVLDCSRYHTNRRCQATHEAQLPPFGCRPDPELFPPGYGRPWVSGASTPLSFFAPPAGTSVDAAVKLYTSTTYHGSFPSGSVPALPNYSATIRLSADASGKASWSFISGDAIIAPFQAANAHLITVKVP